MLKYIKNEQSQQDTFVAEHLTLVRFKEILTETIFSPAFATEQSTVINGLTDGEKEEYLDILKKVTEVAKVESGIIGGSVVARKSERLFGYLNSVDELISASAVALASGGEKSLAELATQKLSFAAPKGYLSLPKEDTKEKVEAEKV
jgi:hypothetical protein